MQPNPVERNDRPVFIRMRPSEYERIAEIAQRRNRSFSWMVRTALERQFPAEQR